MKSLSTATLVLCCCISAAGAQSLQETVSHIFQFPTEQRHGQTISGPRIETRYGESKQVVIVDDETPCIIEMFEEGRKSDNDAEMFKRYTKLRLNRVADWKVDETTGPVHLWLLGTGPVACTSAVSGKAGRVIDYETETLECLNISRLTIGGDRTVGPLNQNPERIRKAVKFYRDHFCKGRAF